MTDVDAVGPDSVFQNYIRGHESMTEKFLDARTFIGKTVEVRIDRPFGSRHPKAGFLYPVNYGYLPNVPAPDGDELDAYVLGVFEPVERFSGECIAVIQRLDDEDDKLIVVPVGKQYSDAQILALTEFQERFFAPVVTRQMLPGEGSEQTGDAVMGESA